MSDQYSAVAASATPAGGAAVVDSDTAAVKELL